MGLLYGCATAIDAINNNTGGVMIRGVKFNAGSDVVAGQPAPSVSFTMGSLAMKGKGDRTVMLIDNNTTDILTENYDTWDFYQNVNTSLTGTRTTKPRQLLDKEVRKSNEKQFEEGIFVHHTAGYGMSVYKRNFFNLGGDTIVSIGKVGTNTATASRAIAERKQFEEKVRLEKQISALEEQVKSVKNTAGKAGRLPAGTIASSNE